MPPKEPLALQDLFKWFAGFCVGGAEYYLVLKGLVPASQFEILVLAPILTVIGLHQARNSGVRDGAAQNGGAAPLADPNP